MKLSIREMEVRDIDLVVNYFADSSKEYLLGMGADPSKLPSKKMWSNYIKEELKKLYSDKKIYYIIWLKNGCAIGHSNINKINFGKDAFMHLHIWDSQNRGRGLGFLYLKNTIPYYFAHFELKKIISEPYSLNNAPINTLTKLGFKLDKEYTTIPGSICFNQKVKRFCLTRSKWHSNN